MSNLQPLEPSIGTPQKRVKLNYHSTNDASASNQLLMGTVRVSLLHNLHYLHANKLNNPSNWATKTIYPEVSCFYYGYLPDTEQLPDVDPIIPKMSLCSNMLSDSYPTSLQYLPLQRKNTEGQDFFIDSDSLPSLYRYNSTIEAAPRTQHIQFGDNIYIQQIQHTYDDEQQLIYIQYQQRRQYQRQHEQYRLHQEQYRLQQDYHIHKCSRKNSTNNQHLICLNKLERIFYYVKKTGFQNDADAPLHKHYSFVQTLISNQIKVYNRDYDNKFIRFYQSWTEGQWLYSTFELAAASLEDATRSGIRLKESEAWDLITDCCSSLQWLQETVQEHHLNIKPGNILKCKDKYKLADLYGRVETLSAYLGDARYLACSANYVAPELLHFKGYWVGLNLLKADIYSLGICVIENLVDAKCMQFGYVKLKHLLERNMQGYSPALRKTLLRMVNTDPQQRPQAAELSYISLYDADCNNSRGKELRRRNTI